MKIDGVDKVRVAAVQPPVPEGREGRRRCVERGLELAREAARSGAEVICLPEYFGVFGAPGEQWRAMVARGDEVLKRCSDLARRARATVLCPSVEVARKRLFSTTWVLGADGEAIGKYRKVHLTLSERENKGISAGEDFPVFAITGLTFGVMTCYDGYFPESARILALRKAQVIFWPSLQRAETEEVIRLQAASRAVDNCVYVVRSSYGHPKGEPWSPGMMVGMSCIVDYEGRVISDLGHEEGYLLAEISPAIIRPRRRSFEGALESPRRYLFADRRPEVYREMCRRQGDG